MRIEAHSDTVSFDGGTMSRDDALRFAVELANVAWGNRATDREGELTLTTVGAVAAMKDIDRALISHRLGIPSSPAVNDVLRDRQIARMSQAREKVPSV